MADRVTIRVAVGWGLSAVGWVVSTIIAKLLNKGFSYLGIDGAEKLKDRAEELKELETKLLEMELFMEAIEESPRRNELEKLLPKLKDMLDECHYCLEKLVLYESDSKSLPSSSRNWVKKLHSALPKSWHPKKGQFPLLLVTGQWDSHVRCFPYLRPASPQPSLYSLATEPWTRLRLAIHRSDGSFAAVASVAFSMGLVLLFCCLRWFNRTLPGSPTREQLKVIILLLMTLLLRYLYLYNIAAIMTQTVQTLVCAAATELGGFFAFFLHREEETDDVAAPFWNDRRVQITPSPGSVLAPLRRLSPRRADLSRAHAPRDIAWSIARLILDSGATSHAVGNICLLEGYQPYNPPWSATLADGRNLRILGIGRIERGNFSIPNVELVEGLQDGLISVRQLDREHGLISCFGNGICRIMLADGTEVGGAFVQDADSLYVLRYLEVPEP